jgi:hypothetical protein
METGIDELLALEGLVLGFSCFPMQKGENRRRDNVITVIMSSKGGPNYKHAIKEGFIETRI